MRYTPPHRRQFDVAPRQEDGSCITAALRPGDIEKRFDIAPRQNRTRSGIPSSETAEDANPTSSSSSSFPSSSSSDIASTSTFSSSSASTETPSSSGSTSSSQARNTSSASISSSPSPTSSSSSFEKSNVLSTESSSTSLSSTISASVSSSSLVIPLTTTGTPSAKVPGPATFIISSSSTPVISGELPSDAPTSIISTYTFSPSATNTTSAGLADGFWQNTGAVAGTFTALGVFVLGIIAAFVFLRRRRARKIQSENDLFETFHARSGSAAYDSGQAASSHDHTTSPHSSVAELAMQTPMDAYASNHMYNPHPPQYAYAPDYPPGTTQNFADPFFDYSNPQMAQQAAHPVATQVQNQNYSIRPPARAVHSQRAAPRGSYERSIDSFYGGP